MGQVLFAPALAGCTSDDVTASAAQVLSGYTALTKDSNDDPISGTMTNRGAWTSSSSGSGHIAIPAGYHNGSGYVDCSGAYNAGVTAADARANTSSANYKAGIASVTVSASASGRTVTATASNGKTASASVAYAGSNGVVSVSTSGGSGNQSFDITDGWCTSIKVDRTGAYNKGVTDADARTNTSSANYKAGYNAGISAADGRVNTSSASYTSGYNAGVAVKKTISFQLTGDKTNTGSLPGGKICLQTNCSWTVSTDSNQGENKIGIGNSRGNVYTTVSAGKSYSGSGSVWINMGAWGSLTISV